MTHKTEFVVDGVTITMKRVFDAPKEILWKALFEKENVLEWWGPREHKTEVLEMDVRPGGKWRMVNITSDGFRAPFRGEYLEVDPPSRMVNTEIFDMEPTNRDEDAAIVTTTLEDQGNGTTLLTQVSKFPSEEAIKMATESGMESGARESYERLFELVDSLCGRSRRLMGQ